MTFQRLTPPTRPFRTHGAESLLIALSLSVSTSCGTTEDSHNAVGPEGSNTNGSTVSPPGSSSANGGGTVNNPSVAPGVTTANPTTVAPGSGATGAVQPGTTSGGATGGGATGAGGTGGATGAGATGGGATGGGTGAGATGGSGTGAGVADGDTTETTGAGITDDNGRSDDTSGGETDTAGSDDPSLTDAGTGTDDSDEEDPGAGGATSPGCGAASPLQAGTLNVDVEGTGRNYVLDVPADYDPNTPYRLVFVWHPLGGSASQVVNGGYDGLKSLANGSAIFVAPDGTDGGNAGGVGGKGWWNDGDKDMKFFSAMFEELNAGLCIDQERIFSTGFSFGGMMSYTIGTQFDVFRAIGPTSGNLSVIPHEDIYTGPLAVMGFHGDADDFVTTAGGRQAMEHYRMRNNCDSASQPVDPSPCVEYQGCDVPTIWCEYPGAHSPWNQMPQAVWSFFSQF